MCLIAPDPLTSEVGLLLLLGYCSGIWSLLCTQTLGAHLLSASLLSLSLPVLLTWSPHCLFPLLQVLKFLLETEEGTHKISKVLYSTRPTYIEFWEFKQNCLSNSHGGRHSVRGRRKRDTLAQPSEPVIRLALFLKKQERTE